jgi:predicted ABC-type ATPase
MPILTVIAGPNGSGKSTLTDLLVRQGIEFGEYLNADEIARELSGPPEWISRKAQQIVRDRRDAALNERRDHAFETVMSHPSHIQYMAQAADSGFEVRLFFVATENPAINLDRVTNRVLHGGHPVPPDRIIDRYQRCLGNLPDAIRAANECFIYDNSFSDGPLRLLANIGLYGDERWLTHMVPDSPSPDREIVKTTPDDIPAWWLKILLQIKPTNSFASGILPK